MSGEDPIPPGLLPEIRAIVKSSIKIKSHSVPRNVLSGWGETSARLRLVCFTDAGQCGQVTRMFVQSATCGQDGRARCAYLAGKHRLNQDEVAGSVPRAELS